MAIRTRLSILVFSALLAVLLPSCAYEREEIRPKREYEIHSSVVGERPTNPTEPPSGKPEQRVTRPPEERPPEEQPKPKKRKKKKSKKNKQPAVVPFVP